MQLGVCNYITNLFNPDEIIAIGEKAMERKALLPDKKRSRTF